MLCERFQLHGKRSQADEVTLDTFIPICPPCTKEPVELRGETDLSLKSLSLPCPMTVRAIRRLWLMTDITHPIPDLTGYITGELRTGRG
jgi:hypothetical protein